MKSSNLNLKKILLFAFAIVVVYGLYQLYELFSPNTYSKNETQFLLIPTGSSLINVYDIIQENGLLKDLSTFKSMANRMAYNNKTIKPGRFKITPGMSNFDLIRVLKSGKQTPVNLVIHNERTIEDLAGRLGSNLEADSMQFLQALRKETTLDLFKCNLPKLIGQFIPNTYEVYWTTKPNDLFSRLKKERDLFWESKNRVSKAENLGLSKDDIMTFASIVEKETSHNPEKPTIAGLYFNRLKRNMPLQSDPTVIFALKDFTIKRVLNGHLQIDSPYNTYKNIGLPPGPICIPSLSSIEAVLNMERHNYLYMCAKPNGAGSHSFAESYPQHLQYAAEYRKWLDSMGI